MRSAAAIAALLGLLVGIGASALWRSLGSAEPEHPAGPSIPTAAPTAPGAERAAPLSEPRLDAALFGALAERMAGIEEKLDQLSAEVRTLAERTPRDSAEPVKATRNLDPEQLRAAWTQRIEEAQKGIDRMRRESGGRPNPVADSHQMDLDRARVELRDAADLDALLRLAEKNKGFFVVPR